MARRGRRDLKIDEIKADVEINSRLNEWLIRPLKITSLRPGVAGPWARYCETTSQWLEPDRDPGREMQMFMPNPRPPIRFFVWHQQQQSRRPTRPPWELPPLPRAGAGA